MLDINSAGKPLRFYRDKGTNKKRTLIHIDMR